MPDAVHLINQLGDITSELVQNHKELATVQKGREETYRDAWVNSTAESLAGRSREADFAVADLDGIMYELKGNIAALDRQYRYLELYLTHLDKINGNK